MNRFAFSLLLPGLLAFSLLIGCGGTPAGSDVQVRVTSTAVPLDETDSIEVVFVPEGEGQSATASGSAREQPLKAFRTDAAGVAPGRYKVVVRVTPYAGMAPPQRVAATEQLNKQFEHATTPLRYEVTADKEQAITINLDDQSVTKG
jgi:hypothetical protein